MIHVIIKPIFTTVSLLYEQKSCCEAFRLFVIEHAPKGTLPAIRLY